MNRPPSRRSTRFSMRSKRIGQLLLEAEAVKADHIAKALKIQERQGGLLGQILRDLKVCPDTDIAKALLMQVQVTDIHCEELVAQPGAVEAIPLAQCLEDKLCPFERLGNLLCVVMGNPLNRRAINAIEESSKLKVKTFKAPWPKIKELIDRSYGASNELTPSELPTATQAPIEEEALLEEPQEQVRAPVQLPLEGSPARPAAPDIRGLDDLSEDNAEVIEADRRGLTRRLKPVAEEPPPQPKTAKKAKVNVDLDTLDLGAATEVVPGTGEQEEEQWEEIGGLEAAAEMASNQARKALAREAGAALEPAARSGSSLAVFRKVPVSYFYAQGEAPAAIEARSAELESLLALLPIAEMVASSREDYVASETGSGRVKRGLPIQAQPAPEEPQEAVAITQFEFDQLAARLEEDPVGDWYWLFAAGSPVPALEYQA